MAYTRRVKEAAIRMMLPLERITPMFRNSGYIAAMDHLVPPEVSYPDFLYFSKRLKEIIGIDQ